MFYIASTRFNNKTYKENIQYRENHDEKVIYGTDIKINSKYSPGSLIFVIEMNNEKNKIEGIGLIRNNIIYDKKHKIYENSDYNRYIYRGDYWISRDDILSVNKEIVDICELILFTGKSHMKRVSGIAVLTEKLFTNWIFEYKEFKDSIKNLFLVVFGNIHSNTNINK